MGFSQILFYVLLVAACCYAAGRGGAPERIAAAAMVCALAATLTFAHFRPPTRGAYSAIEVGIALTDLSLFLVIVAIALVSTRFWPIAMASMMGCGLFGHLTKPLGPDILPRAYYIAVAFWSYPELILLAVATWRHRTRLARYGVDYPWMWKLPRRYRDGWSVNELAPPLPQR
jgi:hypothetical protein